MSKSDFNTGEIAMENANWGFSLPPLENETNNLENDSNYIENDKAPKMTFNPEEGVFSYADEHMRKLYEVRQKLHNTNRDPLAVKQEEMARGLEEIGLSRKDLGKTGNSRTGEVSEKHKKTAQSQIEDAKDIILRRKQLQR